MRIDTSEQHDRAVKQLGRLQQWITERWAESVKDSFRESIASIEAALDDYYRRENAEWEKAKNG